MINDQHIVKMNTDLHGETESINNSLSYLSDLKLSNSMGKPAKVTSISTHYVVVSAWLTLCRLGSKDSAAETTIESQLRL